MSDVPPPASKTNALPGLRAPAQVIAGHVINSSVVGMLFAGAGGLVLPRLLRTYGLALRGGEVAYLLVCLGVLAALVAFLVYSALYQFKAVKIAQARAAEAAARQKRARRPKDWGDLLEEQFDTHAAVFPAAPAPEEEAPSEDELPPELKGTEPSQVPFENAAERARLPQPELPSAATSPPAIASTASMTPTPTPPPSPDPALLTFAERAHEMVTIDSLEFSDRERFGLHLFIAGACGELARHRAWTAAEGQAALVGALTQIGMTRELAEAFAVNANAFAQVDALRPMIDGGAAAMNTWSGRKDRPDNGAEAFYGMSMLFTDWSSSAETIAPPDRLFLVAASVQVVPLEDEGISPETYRAILRGTKSLIEGEVSRGGGSVVRDVHTGLAARFAYGEGAVRTAVAIQEAAHVWARSWDKYRITLQVAVDTAFAATVGEAFVSEGLLRTVRLLLLTPEEQIICTEPVRREALQGDSFLPQVLPGMSGNSAALFQVPWTREAARAEHKPVEYRQIGGTGNDILKEAKVSAALEDWLKTDSAPNDSAPNKSDQSRA